MADDATKVMDESEIRRALKRIAHEIVERNKGAENLVIIGVQSRGVPMAQRLAKLIGEIEGVEITVGSLNVALYRDDYATRSARRQGKRYTVRRYRQERDTRGRGAVHRPDYARRARCDHGPRQAGGDTARGADRPRPSRTADPRGLRRQEPADGDTRESWKCTGSRPRARTP